MERAVRELREETEEEDRAAMIICGMAGASAASAISVDEEMEADVEVGGGATAGACGRSGSKEGGGEEICVVSGPSMEEEKGKDEEGKKKVKLTEIGQEGGCCAQGLCGISWAGVRYGRSAEY